MTIKISKAKKLRGSLFKVLIIKNELPRANSEDKGAIIQSMVH